MKLSYIHGTKNSGDTKKPNTTKLTNETVLDVICIVLNVTYFSSNSRHKALYALTTTSQNQNARIILNALKCTCTRLNLFFKEKPFDKILDPSKGSLDKLLEVAQNENFELLKNEALNKAPHSPKRTKIIRHDPPALLRKPSHATRIGDHIPTLDLSI